MRRGHSLIEAVLATFLLGLVVVLLLNLLPTSWWSIKKSEFRSQAASIAQSVISRAQAGAFEELQVGTTQTLPTVTRGGIDYTVRQTVGTVGTRPPELLKSLRVTVSWATKDGEKTLTREIYLAKTPR